MKLKRKLKYKGSYMYNTIRKDVVKWLKNNNYYYKDININEIWADEWEKDHLGILLDANMSDDDDDENRYSNDQKNDQ